MSLDLPRNLSIVSFHPLILCCDFDSCSDVWLPFNRKRSRQVITINEEIL